MDKANAEGGFRRIARGEDEKKALLHSGAQKTAKDGQASTLSARLEQVLKMTSELPPAGGQAAGEGPKAFVSDAENRRMGMRDVWKMEGDQIQGYDPSRIPASVFARTTPGTTPGTPPEWSVASNESLFSIQLGNSNFSGDNGFLLESSLGEVADEEPANMDLISTPPFDDGTSELSLQEDDAILSSPALHRPSDASSIRSFAFPILPGGSPSPRAVGSQQIQRVENQDDCEAEDADTLRRTSQKSRFWCFSCTVCHAD